jgi:hypothetical protein
MKFENLFGRRLTRSVAGIREPIAKERLRRRRRSSAAQQFIATAESLEERRLLAFSYLGINHTAPPVSGPTNEAYQWNFELFNNTPSDPAIMYVRQNDLLNNRIEFSYSTAFSGLPLIDELAGFSPPQYALPTTPQVTGPGYISLISTPYNTNWNFPGKTTTENFYLAKLRVTCAPGTIDPTFVLQTGDTFTLALEVDFSNAAAGSVGRVYINAPLADTNYSSTNQAPNLAGWTTSYEFKANEIFIQAPATPRYSNYYAASNLISIENAVTGGLTALVSDGDFKIEAGASVTGSTSVRLGQGVPLGASTSSGWGYGGNGGDILIDGEILGASDVLLQVNSLDPRRILTGASGKISGTGSLGLYNMGGDGGLVDIRTANFGVTNIFAGSPASTSLTVKPVANISINVNQTDGDLVLNSLPASQGAISLKASDPAGKTIKVNANFDTQASLTLDAGTLDIIRPISTSFGDLTLLADTIKIGSGLSAGTQGIGNLAMTARTGGITLTSAAVAQAPGGSVLLSSAQGITSSATLSGVRLEMTAGAAGSINVKSNVNAVRAKAGQSITIADDDGLTVEDAQTTSGTITVTAKGLLTLDAITTGAGDIIATTTAAGLMVRDLQTTNGNIKLTANDGDITILGDVTAGDTAKIAANDLFLTADKGNVVLDPAAVIVSADQINLTSPLGRILSPGRVTSVVVDSSGSDYASAPSVTLSSGSGAVATPKVGDGFVTALRIANGGTGYTTAPSIVFDNTGTSGSGAAATAQVSQGVITGITITNRGTGYKTAPTIRVVGGSGSNAEIFASINGLTELAVSYPSIATAAAYGVAPTVVISSGEGATTGAISVDGLGRIQSVNVSTPGSGYVVPPTVAITDSSGSGSGATAIAVLTTGLPSVTVASAGTGYSGGTTVTFPAPGGGGATATGIVSLGLTLASVTGPTSTGSGYAVGDLVEAIAGSGAQFQVTGISGGGVVTAITPTATGGNYTTGDALYLAGNGGAGLILTVTSVDAGGRINTVTISSPGTGFSVGNVLAHVGGSGGRFEVDTVSGSGAITGLKLVIPGSGYTNRPTALAGGSGFGAAPTFNDQNYQVAGVTVLTPGSGYNPSASVGLTLGDVGSGTGASVTGEPASVVGSITVLNSGSGYAAATTTVTLTSPASGGGASSQVVSVDGQGSILSVNLSANGAGYTGAPTVTIVDNSGSGRGASAIANLTGGVTELLLDNGGAGYTVAPTVTIAAPLGGGTAATAIAVLGTTGSTTGVVQSLRIISSGSGYVIGEVPAVMFMGANATVASATATVTDVVTGITITSAGLGYDPSTTRVSIDPIGSGATGVANLTGGVLSVSILSGGSGYSDGTTTVTISGPAGGGAAATATPTIVGGVITALTITNPGYGYAKGEQPTVMITGGDGLADASATVSNIVGSIRVTASGSGYLSTALPTVKLVPFGSGAAATSTIVLDGVTGYVVDAAGSGYTSSPIATITGVGTGASATVSTSAGEVTSVVPATGGYGTGYTVPPNVVISGGGGSGAQVSALVSGVTDVAVTNPGSYYAVAPTVLFSSPAAGGRVAEGTAVISDVVQLSAQRLSWTAMEQPLSAIVSQFDRVRIALTGAGDIDIDRPDGSLILEGVSTVDGSITVSASALTVTGAILTGDASSQRNRFISLEATGGDLLIDAPVGSLLTGTKIRTPLADSVTLLAPAGAITSTTTPPGLVTTNTIIFDARDGATLNTDTNTIRGAVQGSTAAVSITQTTVDLSSNTLPLTVTSVTANGGSIAIKTDNVLTVGTVDAGATGTISLASTKNILASATPPAVANVVGKSATISSTSGKIDLDVSLESLTASAVASSIAIDSVGTGSIDLVSVTARDGIRVGAVSDIVATSVTASTGGVSLTASGAASNVRVGQISAQSNTVTIDAGSDIVSSDPLATTRNVSATVARLTAGGKIDLRTDITTLSAAAVGDITIDESSAIVLGDSKAPSSYQYVKSTGGAVAVTAGGAIDAFWVESATAKNIGLTSTGAGVTMQSVKGDTVAVSAQGNVSQATGATSVIDATTLTVAGNGQPIKLDTADNRIGTFSATNAAGSIALKDTAGGLTLAGITGGTVTIGAAGVVDQTAAVNAGAFTVNGNGSAITLNTQKNTVSSFAASNGAGNVLFNDTAGGLTIAGITGGAVTIGAAGAIDQTAAIKATSLDVTASAGAVTLDRADNAVATFSGSNPGQAISFTDSTGFNIGANGLTGGAVVLAGNGNLTQTGLITATSLSVTDKAGSVDFDLPGNQIGILSASNGNRPVIIKTATALQVTGIQAGATFLRVGGDLTQMAAIKASSLDVTASAGAVTFDRSDNVVTTFSGNNPGRSISFSDTTGFGIGANGLNGGNVVLVGNGNLTQTGLITATSLSVTDTAGSVHFDTVGNRIGSLFASNGDRPVIIRTATALQVTGLQAGATFLRVGGDLTQTAAIKASSLDITASTGAVTLTNAGNSVASLGVVLNPGGGVSFVNAGTFATTAITAGTAAPGDGNILLQSISGDINVNGSLTALNDRVTLEARKGTFTLAAPPVKIDAEILVYYVLTPPTYSPGQVPEIIAANGDLTISKSGPITFGGYTTDGNITITGTTVEISGLLQTTGIGKAVAITATAGDVTFVGAGAIDNAPALLGTTTLSAAAGTVESEPGTKVSGATTSLTVGQAVTFPGTIDATSLTANGAGTAIDLSGSNTLEKVTVTKGSDVTIRDTTGGLTIGGIDATGTVTVTAAGAVDQTGAVVAGAFSVNGDGSAITLDTQANKVSSFAANNKSGNVLFNDTAGGLTIAGITGGTVTIGAAGAVDQTAAVNAGAFTVNGNGSAITLNTQANVVSSFAASNGAGSVLFNDTAGGLTIAGITGGTVTIGAAGAIDQTAAIKASSLDVTTSAGAVTLDRADNAVATFSGSNPGRSISFTDSTGFGIGANGLNGGAVVLVGNGNLTQTGLITATSLSVTDTAGSIDFDVVGNTIGTLFASNGSRPVIVRTASALQVTGLQAGATFLRVGGDLTQTAAINASSLDVTASAGAVTLANAGNVVTTFSGSNPGRPISFTDSTGFGIGANGLNGGAVVLVGNGNLTQTGLITATSLSVTDTAGSIDFDVVGNTIGSLFASNGSRPVIVRTASALQVTGLQAGATFLRVGGDLTQTAAINASSLDITASAGAVTLDRSDNVVATFSGSNPGRPISFTDSTGFGVGANGLNGGAVVLVGNGNLTQTGLITATSLSVTDTAGSIDFDLPGNQVGSLFASNGNRPVIVRTATALQVTGLQAGATFLRVGGDLTQTAAITAASLDVLGNGSPITLNTQANDVSSFAASNGVGSVLFNDTVGGLTLAGITGGTVTIGAAGAVDQTGAVNAGAFTVNGNGSAITLNTQANAVTSFAANNSTGNVLFNDTTGSLTLAGITGGTVAIGAAGAVDQSGAINAGAFTVTGNGSTITLNTQANTVTSFAASNSTGSVLFNDTAGSLTLAGITGGTVTIGAAGAVVQTAAVNAGAFTVNGNGSAITLNSQANAVTSFAASNSTGSVLFNDAAGSLTLAGITGGTVTIGAAGAVDQSGTVNAGAFTVNGNGSAITLNTKNNTVTSFAASNGAGNVFFNDTAGSLTLAGITGGTVTIGAAGAVDQTGAVNAGAFTVNGNGSAITLNTQNNAVTSFAASNGAGNVLFNDTTGSLTLAGITGGTVAIGAAGAVDQSGAINAGAFTVTGNGSAITLNTQANIVTSFAASNSTGSVLFNDTAGSLTLAGITGGTVTIGAAGAVDQSGAVNAGAFTVNGNGSAITLNTKSNIVTSFAASNSTGNVLFDDTAGGLTLAGITGGTVTIGAAGAVDQSGAVNAGAFTVNGNGSAITLNTRSNTVTSFAASNGAGNVFFNDTAGSLTLAGITGGTVTIGAAGAVNQTSVVKAGSFTVNGNGGAVTLTQANVVDTFSASNGTGAVSFTDSAGSLALGNVTSGPLTIAAAGPVSINQTTVSASGNAVITTQAGGGLQITGPQPGGLLQSTTQVNLSGVQGTIALINGGLIVAPTIVGNGKNISVGGSGGTVATTPELNAAVAAVNSLPAISGSAYEIIVTANMSLTQTLTFNRPVDLRGTSADIVLSGSPAVINGLTVNAGASGSRISNLAFSGFSGTGIQFNAAQRASLTGVRVTGTTAGTGAGLVITGNSTGTIVRGNVFANNPFGIRILSATGATIGGTVAGQRNSISGAARAGVFASGFCTNSSVIKTAFTTTPVPYNIGSSRNLRVVQ